MRAIWSGSLSFGLINIPVRLYSAAQDRALRFSLLEKGTLCPIGYARVCKSNHREVKYEDIVKGYELEKGDYVVLQDEDFKRANAKKTSTIDIESFADEGDIDAKYFEKPYFVEPDKKAEKAYVLLREALKKSGKVALARFVIRNRERIGALKVEMGVIMLNQMRFESELRDPEELRVPRTAKFSQREIDVALALIDQLTEPFKPSKFKDTYAEDLKRLIAARAKGKKPPRKEAAPKQTTDVSNLLAILRKSLKKEKARSRK